MSKFVEVYCDGNYVLVNVDLITFLDPEERRFWLASGECHRLNRDYFDRLLKAVEVDE